VRPPAAAGATWQPGDPTPHPLCAVTATYRGPYALPSIDLKIPAPPKRAAKSPYYHGTAEENDELAAIIQELSDTPDNGKEVADQLETLVETRTPEQLDVLAGHVFRAEEGYTEDMASAAALWKAASDQGYANATYSYAQCLRSGDGVEKPQKTAAARLLIQLAEQGHPWAQFSLADALAKGEGVKVNEAEALALFKVAAQNGVVPALYNIGNMYADGRGVAQDDVEANRWYRLGLEKGDPHAMFTMGVRCGAGKGGPADPAAGFALQARAAEEGNLPKAHFNVGNFHFLGKGVGQDYALAKHHFEQAAGRGFVAAMINLGNMYKEGRGVEASREAARGWYSRAAQGKGQESQHAQILLEKLDALDANARQ
jgi:TPR repeat protein